MNVVATLRNAKANVHTRTPRSGPRMFSCPNARAKFSNPTSIFQPGMSSLPFGAEKAPWSLSWYTTPVRVLVNVPALSS